MSENPRGQKRHARGYRERGGGSRMIIDVNHRKTMSLATGRLVDSSTMPARLTAAEAAWRLRVFAELDRAGTVLSERQCSVRDQARMVMQLRAGQRI